MAEINQLQASSRNLARCGTGLLGAAVLGLAANVPARSESSESAHAAVTEVAVVPLPRTPLSLKAESYIRGVEPDFLFNHSVRTFLFGAIALKARGLSYDPETAYVAALFHDLGLVPAAASENGSFEIDGANRAEAFVLQNGGTKEQARTVWNAVAMHDMGRVFQSRQSNEALLLGAGAGSDVTGPNPSIIPAATVAEVVKAIPRLQFKKRFTAAAIDHCRRKPHSQIGWLAPLCLRVTPGADHGSVEEEIASAPFAE